MLLSILPQLFSLVSQNSKMEKLSILLGISHEVSSLWISTADIEGFTAWRYVSEAFVTIDVLFDTDTNNLNDLVFQFYLPTVPLESLHRSFVCWKVSMEPLMRLQGVERFSRWRQLETAMLQYVECQNQGKIMPLPWSALHGSALQEWLQ